MASAKAAPCRGPIARGALGRAGAAFAAMDGGDACGGGGGSLSCRAAFAPSAPSVPTPAPNRAFGAPVVAAIDCSSPSDDIAAAPPPGDAATAVATGAGGAKLFSGLRVRAAGAFSANEEVASLTALSDFEQPIATAATGGASDSSTRRSSSGPSAVRRTPRSGDTVLRNPLLLVRLLALQGEDAREGGHDPVLDAERDDLSAVLLRVGRCAEQAPDLLRRPEARDERGPDAAIGLDPVLALEVLAAQPPLDRRLRRQRVRASARAG